MEKGSSSSASALNGLQFGKKIYFEDVGSGGSPAKKGRFTAANGGQPPRCQVEGCLVDLSEAKTYYSRHKVCGMHSKSSTVIVAGIHQRFCQQCSRFHKLTEFDQGKRSCRRRLACHNERRRKAQPVSSVFNSTFGNISSTTGISPNMFDRKIGGYLMDFTAISTPAGHEPWLNVTRGLGNQLQLPWQTNLHNPLPSYSSHGVTSVNCFNGVSDSVSALSLLSNPQSWTYRARPSSIGMNGHGLLGTIANTSCTTMFQPPVNHIGQFPDLGSGQAQHQVNGQYNGELGLAQPNERRFHDPDRSRGYDSFV